MVSTRRKMQEDQDSGRRRRWRPGRVSLDRKPHFFKIIVSADQQNQLRIPPEFVRNHGRDLSNWARLTVPHTGIVLEVELVKSGDELWLRRGWDQFMKAFSIGYGYFLVFRYEGNSRFHVIIFDLSATEVEYPLMAAGNWDQLIQSEPKEVTKAEKVDHINGHGKGCLLADGDDDDDVSLEILDHSPIGMSTPDMCVVDMTGEGTEEDDSSSRLGKMDAPAPDHLPGEERRIWNMTKTKTMNVKEAFRNESRCFMVVMRPSYVSKRFHLHIPMGHGKKYLAVKGDRAITFHAIGSRKKWRARYCVDCNGSRKISSGWGVFARENRLNVGDVCVFEMIQGRHHMYKVHIFPDENACGIAVPREHVQRNEDPGRPTEESLEDPVFNQGNEAELEDPMDQEENQGPAESSPDLQGEIEEDAAATPTRKKRKEHASSSKGEERRIWSVTKTKTINGKEAILQKAEAFRSESPSFMVVMWPSYVSKFSLSIPMGHGKKYLAVEGDRAITLHAVGSRKKWRARYRVDYNGSRKITSGWDVFARENRLNVGDVCVFEMIQGRHHMYNVHIFRDENACGIAVPREHVQRNEDPGRPTEESLEDPVFNQGNEAELEDPMDQEEIQGPAESNPDLQGEIEDPAAATPTKKKRKEHASSSKGEETRKWISGKKTMNVKEATLRSKSPSFMVVMRPSYVSKGFSLNIPMDHGKKYLAVQGDRAITFHALGSRKKWRARYSVGQQGSRKISSGWDVFARENHLNVGDVCMFEMIQGRHHMYKVHIFRDEHARGIAVPRCDHVQRNEDPGRPKEEPPEDPVFNQGNEAELEDLMDQEENQGPAEFNPDLQGEIEEDAAATPTKKKRKEHASSSKEEERPIWSGRKTKNVKEIILQKAEAFRSESPSFIVVMQPSYVSTKLNLHIPIHHGKKYLANKKNNMAITLRAVGSSKKWRARCTIRQAGSTWISRGWDVFARENHLNVGDVCVFEMIQGHHHTYKVHIFRDEHA
ncbi:hypothetical protein Dimus_019655 [Dionaea muscipula]